MAKQLLFKERDWAQEPPRNATDMRSLLADWKELNERLGRMSHEKNMDAAKVAAANRHSKASRDQLDLYKQACYQMEADYEAKLANCDKNEKDLKASIDFYRAEFDKLRQEYRGYAEEVAKRPDCGQEDHRKMQQNYHALQVEHKGCKLSLDLADAEIKRVKEQKEEHDEMWRKCVDEFEMLKADHKKLLEEHTKYVADRVLFSKDQPATECSECHGTMQQGDFGCLCVCGECCEKMQLALADAKKRTEEADKARRESLTELKKLKDRIEELVGPASPSPIAKESNEQL